MVSSIMACLSFSNEKYLIEGSVVVEVVEVAEVVVGSVVEVDEGVVDVGSSVVVVVDVDVCVYLLLLYFVLLRGDFLDKPDLPW